MRGSWKLVAFVALVAVGGVMLPSPVIADDYNWLGVNDLEENNSDGSSYFEDQHSGLYPAQLLGVESIGQWTCD